MFLPCSRITTFSASSASSSSTGVEFLEKALVFHVFMACKVPVDGAKYRSQAREREVFTVFCALIPRLTGAHRDFLLALGSFGVEGRCMFGLMIGLLRSVILKTHFKRNLTLGSKAHDTCDFI